MSIYIAHLLRNLNWLNNLDKKQKWSSRLQELLRKAVHWRNEKNDTAYLCTHACDFRPRWENNRKNREEIEVNRLKSLIIFLLQIYLLSKSSAKNSFPSRFPVGNGAKMLHKRKRFTGTNIRCNTLQLEIQHVASFGSNAVHLSIQHVAMRDTTRCMPLLNTPIASFSLSAGSLFLSQGSWLPFQPPKIDSQITLICAKCE